MDTRSKGAFEITSWDEAPYDEQEGVKLSRARVTKTYRGDVEGESTTELLFAYGSEEGSAAYVGIERIIGSVDGRPGGFVLHHSASGSQRREEGFAHWSVVPDSGTGELRGLRGRGDHRHRAGRRAYLRARLRLRVNPQYSYEEASSMREQATGEIETTFWEENAYGGADEGPKFTRANVTTTFRGDIEGNGVSEYLMAYTDDGHASFAGLERIEGRLVGRSGSFAILHDGTFADGNLRSGWSVVPGSGTGDLLGLRGNGTYLNEGSEPTTDYTFEYEFE